MSERFDTFSPPSGGEPDWEKIAPETDDGGELDPRAAASLLEQTTRQAERQFDIRPIYVFPAAAITVLIGYGAVWFSVRHQHPYSGPSGTALGVLYGVLALWILFSVVVLKRGLSGRSSPQRRLEGIVFATIWILVYVFQGALAHDGVSKGVVYGIWPAIAPLLVVGAAAAGYEAGRRHLGSATLAVAAVALAAIASYAGPRDVWGVMAVGLCGLLVIGFAAQLWQRRERA